MFTKKSVTRIILSSLYIGINKIKNRYKNKMEK